ncbi:cell wall glycoprotein [Fusarium fujikuroi]|nr:cell wall glycoprotein [Fusarium fujikuroi]
MGFIKSASIASVLIGAATASPHYAPPSNETVKYTTEVVTHLTTYCPEATTLTYGEKTYTITEATTLTIEDCSCTITKPVATGTGYAAPPKPTHAKDCAEMCSDKYDDCRATTLTYGNKTIPVTAPGTVTVPDCHFTTTKPIVPTGYAPPKPSSPAENKGCAEKCSDAYNKCRTGADANMSYCAATYAECLGYSPFNGEGSLVTPTACSVAPVATKPATAPAYNPPAGTKPAGAPPAITPTHVVTAGAAQVVPAGIIAVVGALAML